MTFEVRTLKGRTLVHRTEFWYKEDGNQAYEIRMCESCGDPYFGKRKSGGRTTKFCSISCRSQGWQGEGHPRFRNEASHNTLHVRLRQQRGKACEFPCADCGETARERSWVHDTDPQDIRNYEPRCASCHRNYDGNCGYAQVNPALKE